MCQHPKSEKYLRIREGHGSELRCRKCDRIHAHRQYGVKRKTDYQEEIWPELSRKKWA